VTGNEREGKKKRGSGGMYLENFSSEYALYCKIVRCLNYAVVRMANQKA